MTRLGHWIGQLIGRPMIDLIGRERVERILVPILERLQGWIDRHPRIRRWLTSAAYEDARAVCAAAGRDRIAEDLHLSPTASDRLVAYSYAVMAYQGKAAVDQAITGALAGFRAARAGAGEKRSTG